MILLAIPAAVWIWAGVETVFGSCDYECGDEGQLWALLVALTAPLIWLGLFFVGGGPPGLGAWAVVLALACLVFAGYWGLIGAPVLLCGLVVIAALVVAGRRRSRRYPEEIEPRYP